MTLNMSSGSYHRHPQDHCLPLDYNYGEGSETQDQSGQQQMIPPFDGLPGTQSGEPFVVPSSSASFLNNYSLTNPMTPLPRSSTVWNDSETTLNYSNQNPNGYYGYTPPVTRNDQQDTLVRDMDFSGVPHQRVPRSWTTPFDPRMFDDSSMSMNQFDQSLYSIQNDKNDLQTPPELSPRELDAHSGSQYPRTPLSPSPKMENINLTPVHSAPNKSSPYGLLALQQSEDSDDGDRLSREMTVVDVDEQSADEPYAKLIHRALMSAPNHSMVLQEIYQWFRDNTVKGSADSKGWMNSIRHNLSMNAAFKKTERKVPDDETKKSTEWVLEEFAIKDGVQSTTRYRKGTGAKKFMRSDNPAPIRQSSGRKGGLSASKSKFQRQRVRDDRMDPRRQRHDILRSHYPHQATSSMDYRHNSPSTPPANEPISSPYFLPNKVEYEIQPSYESMCGLDDVQGVYLDGGPVFTDHPNAQFFDGLPPY